MVRLLLIGIGAGVTSALLFATLSTGQAFAVGLFYLTPLPILLAGIAWNHVAGAIAAVTAAVLLGAFVGGWFVLAFLVGIGLPAYILSYLALLARDADGDGTIEWYPPGRIVVASALIAATATSLTIPAFGTDAEGYRGALKVAFERVLRAQTDTAAGQPLVLPGAKDTASLLDLLVVVMPIAASVLSMVAMLANVWLAGKVALMSGRLARPWPDLAAMRFPPLVSLVLALAVAGTFLPGVFAIASGFFTATLILAFAILGLSVIHGASRVYPGRFFILTGVWLSIFTIGWPLLFAALIGLADTIVDIRARFNARPNLPTNRPPND